MPTSLSVFLTYRFKSIKLIVLFLLSPLFFFGQTLTGLWTGALSNDSTTIRKDQSFEIALTEYKGKVYGYSRSEFIVDDTLYYVMKRVKGTIEGDVCEVSDDEIISYNFRGKIDKGVKVVSTFRRNKSDSTWYLDGTWKTNATKKYYSVTGKVTLTEEKDLTASKLFPHLEELNLADDVAFYKERKETPSIVRVVKPEATKTEYTTRPGKLYLNNDVAISVAKPTFERAEARPAPATSIDEPIKKDANNTLPAEATASVTGAENKEKEIINVKKPIAEISQKETKKVDARSVSITPTPTNKKIEQNKIPVVATMPVKTSIDADVVKSDNGSNKSEAALVKPATTTPSSVTDNKQIKTEPVVKTTVIKQTPAVVSSVDNKPKQTQPEIKTVAKVSNPVTASNTIPEKKEVKTEPVVVASVIPEIKKPEVDMLAKSAVIGGRKSEFSQIVSFKSDSLELSLYDNGEIDGDTVSVFMNGEVIMARQGLKSSAIKKTIYITRDNEDFTLVLFADNLGKYPPNTGLLVVHDGEDVYNLRFSSDFQKSSGIVFRRKK